MKLNSVELFLNEIALMPALQLLVTTTAKPVAEY
jgi:hypothetical protein